MPTEKTDFYLPGFRDANGYLLIRKESEDDVFTKYDVSLHVLSLDTKTGLAEIEICVHGAKHVGIYPTHIVLGTPGCLLEDIKKATNNLLDQQGPFKRVGNLIAKKGSVGGITFGKDPDSLVRWLNRTWRDR